MIEAPTHHQGNQDIRKCGSTHSCACHPLQGWAMSRLEKRVNIVPYDQGVITGISVEHGSGFMHQILGVKQTNNSYVLMANTGYEGSNTFRGCGPRIKTHRILGLLECWSKELHTQVHQKALPKQSPPMTIFRWTSESASMSQLGVLTIIAGKMVLLLTVRQSGQSGPERSQDERLLIYICLA